MPNGVHMTVAFVQHCTVLYLMSSLPALTRPSLGALVSRTVLPAKSTYMPPLHLPLRCRS